MEKKDEAEEEAKLQLRAQAKQELDDWYKQHAEQVFIQQLTINHTGLTMFRYFEYQTVNI